MLSTISQSSSAGRPPVLVLVNGPPCAGKSHLTDVLAGSTSLPVLTKDMIKETVYDTAGWADRDWSRRLGTAAAALLWMFARSLLSQGQDCLIEANFRAGLAANELARLTSDLTFTSAQIFVTATPAVLAERFRIRARSRTRHPGHLDAELQHEYSEGSIPEDQLCPIPGTNRLIRLDTTEIKPQCHARHIHLVTDWLVETGVPVELS
ncbi:MAG: AAA family ATPase [Caldilineaceae bacterium]|nr:AAA family ATPase [Caldilineaceae bacterium]